MNARKSINRKMSSLIFGGSLLAVLSLNAVADPTAVLDARAPLHATLLPALKVSASISDPTAAVRWSITAGRPTPVTLMPTLTVTPDPYAIAAEYMADLPTLTASNDAR